MCQSHSRWSFARVLIGALLFIGGTDCSAGDSTTATGSGVTTRTGASAGSTGTQGTGTAAGTTGNVAQGTGASAGASGSSTQGTSSGSSGGAGASGSTDLSGDASLDGGGTSDAPSDTSLGDVINGTPDGGAYSRTGWTASSMPPFPTGQKAQNQDLKYSNAFDGNYNTRWSIGDTNSPAQTIGDRFTFDMLEPHSFRKILFWAGGVNGVNGPDPRDYPGALDLSVSNDGTNFGPALGSGTEPQPGCTTACTMPFTITLAQPAVARYVRLTLTQRLKLGGGIWWAISELYVYP